MDREHLDGLGVGLEATTPLFGARVVARVSDPLAQPGGERGDPEMFGGDLCVKKLADMAKVGEPPLPIDGCEHAPWEARRASDELKESCHPRPPEHASPVVTSRVQVLQDRVFSGIDLCDGPADEGGDRGRAYPRRRSGTLQNLE
jgi:hypothetical protein